MDYAKTPLGTTTWTHSTNAKLRFPGVYLAKSWDIANTYPMHCNAMVKSPAGNDMAVSGGVLIAKDGTLPMRVVI